VIASANIQLEFVFASIFIKKVKYFFTLVFINLLFSFLKRKENLSFSYLLVKKRNLIRNR